MGERASYDNPLHELKDRSDEITREVLKTEFSELFVDGMRDRMLVSFYKYGYVAQAAPERVKVLDSLHLRLQKYAETGNTEYLIDAANFAMIEFMHPSRADAHFTPTDSNGSPGRISQAYGRANQHSNLNLIPVEPSRG
jgi:hypothetical protein